MFAITSSVLLSFFALASSEQQASSFVMSFVFDNQNGVFEHHTRALRHPQRRLVAVRRFVTDHIVAIPDPAK
jgi:hypothetical protein